MNVTVFRSQCLLRARLDGSEEAGCKIEMWLRRNNNMARLWFPRRCHELLLQQEACRAWHLQTHFYCRQKKKKRRKEPLTEEERQGFDSCEQKQNAEYQRQFIQRAADNIWHCFFSSGVCSWIKTLNFKCSQVCFVYSDWQRAFISRLRVEDEEKKCIIRHYHKLPLILPGAT